MKRHLAPILCALAITAGLATTSLGASLERASPDTSAGERIEAPVYVDSTDIHYLESFPVQVHLVVSGSLPTACHEPIWTVDTSDDAITVNLWSEADPSDICAAVLEPFEVSIPLGDFETAELPVVLNGEVVGRVVVGEPGTEPTVGNQLSGAGWSFGMCAGLCRADLVVIADDLALRGSDQSGVTSLFENQGALTSEGRAALDAALATLGDVPLEPQYGCPDCADGGARYLVLDREGQTTRHDMEFSAPPPELAELAALTTTFMDALQACQSGGLVTVADDCVSWQG